MSVDRGHRRCSALALYIFKGTFFRSNLHQLLLHTRYVWKKKTFNGCIYVELMMAWRSDVSHKSPKKWTFHVPYAVSFETHSARTSNQQSSAILTAAAVHRSSPSINIEETVENYHASERERERKWKRRSEKNCST